MDDAPEASAAMVLADLRRLNRWFGGHAILRSLARRWFARDESFRALDIGAATGDMGHALGVAFPRAQVVSLDHSLRYLRMGQSSQRVCADAFLPPFASGSFDLVYASLFLHHFEDVQAVELLDGMRRLARRAVIVIDLERHWLGTNFQPLTKRLLGWHPMTVHDGVTSVKAGFLAAELRALAERAGWLSVDVRRHLPWCRLSVCAPASGNE